MPLAGRVGDQAKNSSTGHETPAKGGSPDVFIDGQAALRVNDPGDGWTAQQGSRGVLINGLPAHRVSDATKHDVGDGKLVQGSPDVLIGDRGGGTPVQEPHDRSLMVQVEDAIGRAIEEVKVRVMCPHQDDVEHKVTGSTTLTGLCPSATVTVNKALQKGTWDKGASSGELVAPSHAHVEPPGKPEEATHVVHAPAPPATPPDTHEVHIVRPSTPTARVQLTTVHNWAELVFRAFGQAMPLGATEISILGVREASLSGKGSVDALEADAGAGETDKETTTREARDADFAHATTWNDLLFISFTDTTPARAQHVEVFECTIDAGAVESPYGIPITLEGKLYGAYPGPHISSRYPGSDICLHLYTGTRDKMALAREGTKRYRTFTSLASAKNAATDWAFCKVEENEAIHMHFGAEYASVGNWSTGCTVLHHHLWIKNASGANVQDPKATRYKRFMELYRGAANKSHIPYLVVSSQYVRSYAEWARLAGEKPGDASKPASVIMKDKLKSPAGMDGRYLPSFMTPEFAADVIALAAKADTSKPHAANLRSSMETATFTLSI